MLARLTWGGTIRDGGASTASVLDEWSCSLSVITPAIDTAALVTALTPIRTAIETFHTSAAANIARSARLEWVKFNEVDVVTGVQVTDPTVIYEPSGVVNGAQTSLMVPTYASLKVSLDDGTRDPRSRGGFYLPRYAGALQENGRYDATQISGVLTAVDTMLTAINAAGTGFEVGVWSRVNGAVTASSRIRIGDVPDYISRRKNALREAYQASGLS